MNQRFLMMLAAGLIVVSIPAFAAEAVTTTTTETTPAGNAAVTTTTIIPAPAQSATPPATPQPAPVADGPRDAITGEVVQPKPLEAEEEEVSLRDKVRDKMKNKDD